MKNSPGYSDKIDSYLAGTLTGTALLEFNKEVESNIDFATELQICMELKEFSSASAKETVFVNELESMRSLIAEPEFTISKEESINGRGFNWTILAIGFALVTMLSIGSYFLKNKTTEIAEEPIKNATTIQDVEQVKPAPATPDMTPNKTLENLMRGGLRGSASSFEINKQQADVVLKQKLPVAVNLQGQLETSATIDNSDLTVYLFSNKEADYINFQPVIQFNPELTKLDKGYEVNLNKNVVLGPGLYYYLVEMTESEELLYINKFTIK